MKSFIKILSLLLSACFIQSCTISPFSDDDVVLSVNQREVFFKGEYRNGDFDAGHSSEQKIRYQLSIPKSYRFIEIENDDDWYHVWISEHNNNIDISLSPSTIESKLENTSITQFNGRFTISYKDQVIPIDVILDIDY